MKRGPRAVTWPRIDPIATNDNTSASGRVTCTYRYQELFAFPGRFMNLLLRDFELRRHFVDFHPGVVDLGEAIAEFVRLVC